MKQTAVEWLVEQMKQRENQGLTLSMYELEMFGEKAKEMEKEQIIDAHNCGYSEGIYQSCESGEEYYKETFKSE